MIVNTLLYDGLFLLCLLITARFLGNYIACVFSGGVHWCSRLIGPFEMLFYRAAGINPLIGMTGKQYLAAVLLFNAGGFLFLFALLLLQGVLPWNPQHLPGMNADEAFASAIGFITNTNGQAGASEVSASPFIHAVGYTMQHFLSASVGLAVLIALIRGLVTKERRDLGNFWADLTRSALYILLPVAVIIALLLIGQGVVQSSGGIVSVPLLEGSGVQQWLLGPVASETAIEQLGSGGGGFYHSGAAHPLTNPTAITNLIEIFGMLLVPAACCFAFGEMAKDRRQGWALLAVMLLIFLPMLALCDWAEQMGNPVLPPLGIDQSANFLQSGGNMEGKESRFGITGSSLWAVSAAASSNGAANAMHDSFTPLGSLAPFLLMQFGETVFGGVGSGLYSLLLFALIAVFVAGLMVGRTPEYLGKKIQSFEIKMACLAILVPASSVLLGTALAVGTDAGRGALLNHGPHGFSEVFYAVTAAAMGNGGALAGLSANSVFYHTLLGFIMLLGRFWVIIPVLAIAGSLGPKRVIPASRGTLPTHTPLFVLMLASIVLLTGILTFIPALSLGPIVESLQYLFPEG